MRLLPFEQFTLVTDSPPEEVQSKLAKLVSQRRFTLRAPPEPFQGMIAGKHFKVLRGRLGRGQFRPVIIGDIESTGTGSAVRVCMRLSMPLTIIVLMGFGLLVALFLRSGGSLVRAGLMTVVLFVLMSGSFWFQVKWARLALCEGLGCREVAPEKSLVRE